MSHDTQSARERLIEELERKIFSPLSEEDMIQSGDIHEALTTLEATAREEGAREERKKAILAVVNGCAKVTQMHQDTSNEAISVNTARANILAALTPENDPANTQV